MPTSEGDDESWAENITAEGPAGTTTEDDGAGRTPAPRPGRGGRRGRRLRLRPLAAGPALTALALAAAAASAATSRPGLGRAYAAADRTAAAAAAADARAGGTHDERDHGRGRGRGHGQGQGLRGEPSNIMGAGDGGDDLASRAAGSAGAGGTHSLDPRDGDGEGGSQRPPPPDRDGDGDNNDGAAAAAGAEGRPDSGARHKRASSAPGTGAAGYYPPYGTLAGYDNAAPRRSGSGSGSGSGSAICWSSPVDPAVPRPGFASGLGSGGTASGEAATGEEDAAMEAERQRLEEELYGVAGSSAGGAGAGAAAEDRPGARAEMLPSCGGSTQLSVELLAGPADDDVGAGASSGSGPGAGADLYAGRAYDVRVSLNLDEAYDVRTSSALTPVDGFAWFRFVLCGADRAAFCHPFVPPSPASSGRRSEPGPRLEAAATRDGAHLLTRPVRLDLRALPKNDGEEGGGGRIRRAETTLSLKLPLSANGRYFLLGHATFFLNGMDDPDSVVRTRIDIASTVSSGAIAIKEEPVIQSIPLGFKIAIGVIAGLCCVWHAFLLLSVWRHRASTVMQVAQTPSLALLVLGCLFAAASSVFSLPVDDAFCNLRAPTVLIPGTLVGAVLVGRLWRTHCVLASVLSFGMDGGGVRGPPAAMNFLSLLADWDTLCCLGRCRRRGRGKAKRDSFYKRRSGGASLRAKVTNGDMMRLVAALTLPQCVLQAIKLAARPERVQTEFTEDGSVGWDTCSRDGAWLSLAGFVLLAAIFQLAVLAAWFAGDLPSIFNEKQSIFAASWISLMLLVSGGGVLLTAETVGTSPGLLALLWTLLIASLCSVVTGLLVVPKLRKVWSGDEIIVSNLIRSAVRASRVGGAIKLQSDLSNLSVNQSVVDRPPTLPPSKDLSPNGPGLTGELTDEAGTHPETSVETLGAPDGFGELPAAKDDRDAAGTEPPKEEAARSVSWRLDGNMRGDSAASSLGGGDSSDSSGADSFDVEGLEAMEAKMTPLETTSVPLAPSFGGARGGSRASSIPRTSDPAGPDFLGRGPAAAPSFRPAPPVGLGSSAGGGIAEGQDSLAQLNQLDLSRTVTTGGLFDPKLRRRDKVRIRRTSAPPKGLEVRLLKTREAITHVTTATLLGGQAPLKVWKTLQMDVTALSSQLQNVEFDWTEEDEGADALRESWHREAAKDARQNFVLNGDALSDLRQNFARNGGKFASTRSLSKRSIGLN